MLQFFKKTFLAVIFTGMGLFSIESSAMLRVAAEEAVIAGRTLLRARVAPCIRFLSVATGEESVLSRKIEADLESLGKSYNPSGKVHLLRRERDDLDWTYDVAIGSVSYAQNHGVVKEVKKIPGVGVIGTLEAPPVKKNESRS